MGLENIGTDEPQADCHKIQTNSVPSCTADAKQSSEEKTLCYAENQM